MFIESESILILSDNNPLFSIIPALAFIRTTSVLAVPAVIILVAGEVIVAPVPKVIALLDPTLTPASKVPIPASTLNHQQLFVLLVQQ